MASLPLLTVLVAVALDHVRGRLAWSLVALLYAGTAGYAAVLSAWPAWRFQNATGRSAAGLALFHRTAARPRPVPARPFIMPEARWTWAALGILAALAVAGYGLSRGTGHQSPPGELARGRRRGGARRGRLLVAAWRGSAERPIRRTWARGRAARILGHPAGERRERPPSAASVWSGRPSGTACWSSPRVCRRAATRLSCARAPRRRTARRRSRSGSARSAALESASRARRRRCGGSRTTGPRSTGAGGRLPIRLELGRISRQNPERFAYVDAIEIRRLGP